MSSKVRRSRIGSCLVAAFAAIACSTPSSRPGGSADLLVDDFGDTLRLAGRPARLVSLTPATTELLFAIGAGDRVVGRTTWDVWPPAARGVPDLGPGLRPNVEAVIATRPDLVLLYAAEDNRAAARRLRAAGVMTFTVRMDRIAEFAAATLAIGRATGDSARAVTVRDSVLATIARVAAARRAAVARGASRPSVAWTLGTRPLYVMGGTSFLGELIDSAGGRNAFGDLAAPSPQVSLEELLRRDPDILVMGATSAAAVEADPRWRVLRAVREGRVLVSDDDRTDRPGPRLGAAAEWLADALARLSAQPSARP